MDANAAEPTPAPGAPVTVRTSDLHDGPVQVTVNGTSVVVAQLGDRVLAAVDRCPHRGAPLSAGTVEHNCLVCPYHGWEFDADGEIAAIPALGEGARLPKRARLRTVVIDEVDGSVRIEETSATQPVEPARTVANDDPQLRAGWHPLCRSDEIEPGSTSSWTLLGETIEVDRSQVGQLRCADAFAVTDHLGHVWVAPDEPKQPLIDIPEFDEDGWVHVPMPTVTGRYNVGLLLDNQLDAGHFSFVHRATFGNKSESALPNYDVERDGMSFEAKLRVPINARNDVADDHDGRPLQQHRNMTYRYSAPTSMFLRLDYEEMGGATGILFCFTPIDHDTARMDVDLLFQHPDGFTEAQLAQRLAFEIEVVGEDLMLQDRFEFLEMPLELTAEIHTKADKNAVEMRRILASFYRSDDSAVSVPQPDEHSSAA